MQLRTRPLLAFATAASIGPPAARLAPRRTGRETNLLSRRLVGLTRALLAMPLRGALERATFAPRPPHLLPLLLSRLGRPCGAILGAGLQLSRRRDAGRWCGIGERRGGDRRSTTIARAL